MKEAEKKKSQPEVVDKRITTQNQIHQEIGRRGKLQTEEKPEDGIVELEGGFMLTTSEILDFAEGADNPTGNEANIRR